MVNIADLFRIPVILRRGDEGTTYIVFEPDAKLPQSRKIELEGLLTREIAIRYELRPITSIDEARNFLMFLEKEYGLKEAERYYIFKLLHFQELTPLIYDQNIEEIFVFGDEVVIRDRMLADEMIRTNIRLRDPEVLFNSLAAMAGHQLSMTNPELIFSLNDLHGFSHRFSVALNVRAARTCCKVRTFNKVITPIEYLAKYCSISIEDLALLVMCSAIAKMSTCVFGDISTGKTTFANVLAMFVNPQHYIEVITKYNEIHLPHPFTNVILVHKDEEMAEEIEKALTRADVILVNEVLSPRDLEKVLLAAESAQLAIFTIHAEDIHALKRKIVNTWKFHREHLASIKLFVHMGMRVEQGMKRRYVKAVYYLDENLSFKPLTFDVVSGELCRRLDLDIESIKARYCTIANFLSDLVQRFHSDPGFREAMCNYLRFRTMWIPLLKEMYRALESTEATLLPNARSQRVITLKYDMRFCPYCGSSLREVEGRKYCPHCGEYF